MFEPQPRTTSNFKKASIALLATIGVIGAIATVAVLSQNNPKASSLSLANLQLEEEEFKAFMQKYGKEYGDESEYNTRFKIFRDNSAFIRMFNARGNNWKLGINKFADLTQEEFKELYFPYEFPERTESKETDVLHEDDELELPSKVDWTKKGAVTSVKNQGHCGSCWAFSTAEGVEGIWAIKGHQLVSLSVQELVDCSESYGNKGCKGGLMPYGFEFVKDHGLTSNQVYPYKAEKQSCKKNKESNPVAHITGYRNVTHDNVRALKRAVTQQPVSVAVDADQYYWQFYYGGVVDSEDCGTKLDHGVLIAGYNTEASTPYWKVKNSWGSDWGENGYIRIGIKKGKGVCGIQMMPSFPTLNN